jgi:hypothetical protein
MCKSHYYLIVDKEGGTSCGYDIKKAACKDPNRIDANGNCVACDVLRGYWATGLSLDATGRVSGNICSYQRLTDLTRDPHWIYVVFAFMNIFVAVTIIGIVVCVILTCRAYQTPAEYEKRNRKKEDPSRYVSMTTNNIKTLDKTEKEMAMDELEEPLSENVNQEVIREPKFD